MQVQIHAPFEVNDYLKNIIHAKIEKLSTHYTRIHRTDIFLKLKEDHITNGKIVEINLHLPGKNIFAKDTKDSFEKAVATVIPKLERQLKKRKEKLTK